MELGRFWNFYRGRDSPIRPPVEQVVDERYLFDFLDLCGACALMYGFDGVNYESHLGRIMKSITCERTCIVSPPDSTEIVVDDLKYLKRVPSFVSLTGFPEMIFLKRDVYEEVKGFMERYDGLVFVALEGLSEYLRQSEKPVNEKLVAEYFSKLSKLLESFVDPTELTKTSFVRSVLDGSKISWPGIKFYFLAKMRSLL